MKNKEIVVKPLKSKDFAELLSLTDLMTQMEVLGFLQQNLFDYQMNYFKSQLMIWDDLIQYISDKDKPSFFTRREHISGEYDREKMEYKTPSYYAEYDWNYAQREFTFNDAHYGEDKKKFSRSNRHFFLVDHKTKKLYTINKKLVDKFKFTYEDNFLVCKYYDSRPYVSFDRFAQCSMCDCQHTIIVKFDLIQNCVESFSDKTDFIVTGKCGSWYDSSNEYLRASYLSDETEAWMTKEEVMLYKQNAKLKTKHY
jgi:hypothetical protein